MSDNRKSEMVYRRKKQRQEIVDEQRNKIMELQKFLECSDNGDDISYIVQDYSIIKPRFKALVDIDRESCYSETSSNSGGSSETSRPRRMSMAPERFTFVSPKTQKPKAPKKFIDLNASYEVEAIWNMNLINNQIFVLVKWENYPPKDNTWEPLANVKDCEALEKFLEYEFSGEEEDIARASAELMEEHKAELEAYKKKPKAVIMKELEQFDPIELKCYQLIYKLVRDKTDQYNIFRKNFRNMLILNHFHELDIAQYEGHKVIANDIRENENGDFSISITNDVDFEVMTYFKYVRENVFPTDIEAVPLTDPIGCNCEGGCSRESKCCPTKISKAQFAYKDINNKKRLRLNHTQMIYECNEHCKCDADCLNRVTQQPRKVPLAIFKTSNGRGWGLRTKATIPKGTFLLEYTGEIIDQEESIRRGKQYDEIGLSYLFDLDFNEQSEAVYTIDAFKSGNLARLINHCCEPNCRILPVTTCNQNPSIYKICYFSSRLIKEGEELTFDYNGGTEEEEDVEEDDDTGAATGNIARRHKTLDSCKCGAETCRGFIFQCTISG